MAVTAVRIQDNRFLKCGAVLIGTRLFKYMAPRVGDHSLKVKRLPYMSVMFMCL